MSIQPSSEQHVVAGVGSSDVGELVYSGSVKNIFRSLSDNDKLYFQYSDAYSVFDWGRMPDQMSGKGQALLSMARTFFALVENPSSWQQLQQRNPNLLAQFPVTLTKLQANGLAHHAQLDGHEGDQYLCVDRVSIARPTFDNDTGRYHYYPQSMMNYRRALIPLEVIFRWGTPPGSSLLKRADNPEILRQLGDCKIAPNSIFARPLLEFSTKLEREDRLLTMDEAKWLSGLKQQEWSEFCDTAILCAWLLKDFFACTGIMLWDGKMEFAIYNNKDDNAELVLVDSIGPDELRLTRHNQVLSKEILREFYRPSNWYRDVEQAKATARTQHQQDWKRFCHSSPLPLPAPLKKQVEEIYSQLARELAHNLLKYQSKEQ